MTWKVVMDEDEILLEYISGLNHIAISIDPNGVGYAIREGNEFRPGKFDLSGEQFARAIADIRQAATRT
jgi:hypothetical protein